MKEVGYRFGVRPYSKREAEKKVSKEQAEAALIAERTERENACLAEVNAALEKHRCVLRFIQTSVNGQLQAGVHQVVAGN